MDSNTFGFFGLIVFLIMAYGTVARVRLFSIVGSVLLLILGLFMLSDGITLKTGEYTVTASNETTYEDTNTTVSAGNSTTTYLYTAPPQVSVFDWDFMFGLTFILFGIGGMYIYALQD
jgi:uncharacterized membrane protein